MKTSNMACHLRRLWTLEPSVVFPAAFSGMAICLHVNIVASSPALGKHLHYQQQRGLAVQSGNDSSGNQADGRIPIQQHDCGSAAVNAQEKDSDSSLPVSRAALGTVASAAATLSNAAEPGSTTLPAKTPLATAKSRSQEKSSTSSNGIQAIISPALVGQVSSTINRLTGYEAIDAIKGSVGATDKQLQEVKQQLKAAKAEYEAQLAAQGQLHREVTALLQRKSSWVPADVARFTDLYAAEHQTEQAVAAAKARYSQLSDDAERLQLYLVDLIRERYQQEQVWSDKIRRASTWWTWGLMGLHFASFITVYTVLEPRKRASLQAAVADMLSQHMDVLDGKLLQLAPAAAAVVGATAGHDRMDTASEQTLQQQTQAPHLHSTDEKSGRNQQAVGSSVAQQQQHALQHAVLQELQTVKQRLEQLQQALPVAAAVVQQDQRQQQGQSRWHVPGSKWAAGQIAAAGQSAKALWTKSKHYVQQTLTQHTLQQSSESAAAQETTRSTGRKHDSTSGAEQPQTGVPSAAGEQASSANRKQSQTTENKQHLEQRQVVAADTSRSPQMQSSMMQQPHGVAAAPVGVDVADSKGPPPPSTAVSEAGRPTLLQQLRSNSSVLQVTRGQLTAIAAMSGTVGAALAAVLVAVLRSGGGAAAAGSGSR